MSDGLELLLKELKEMDVEKRTITCLLAEVEIVHNLDTGQDELEIQDINRLKWLGLVW